MIVGDIPVANSRLYPNKRGVVDLNTRLSWKEVNERTNRLAHALSGLGLRKGDRAAVLSENSHELAEFLFAVAKTGLIGLFLNYRLTPANLASIVNDSRPRVLFTQKKYLPTVDRIVQETGPIEHLIIIGDAYEKLIASHAQDEPQVEVNENDVYVLQYTTGSTGMPKGVVLTHKNILTNALLRLMFGRQQEDCVYMSHGSFFANGPLAHFFCAAFMGATTVIPPFSGKDFAEMIEKERVTYTNLNPTTFSIVKDYLESSERKYDLSSLTHLAIGGGQPCPADQSREILDYFHIPYANSSKAYGQSESISAATFLPPSYMGAALRPGATEREREKADSVGKPFGNTRVRVVDQEGHDVPPRNQGEILLKGDVVMKGYWNRPERTEEALRDGWYHTSDLGYFDEEGYLYFVDRKDFLIKSGGLFVSPLEVEKVIVQHPAVVDAAVIGPSDEKWGQRVKALIRLKPGMKATAEEIQEHCRVHLARFKIPRAVTFVKEIPRDPVFGKIDRIGLLKRFGPEK